MAPFLTGNGGSGGEIRIPQLILEIHIGDGRRPGKCGLIIRGALDMSAGLGLSFVSGSLTLSVSAVSKLTTAFLTNNITANEAQLTTVLRLLLPTVLPSLGDGLGAVAPPELFGLQVDGVAVSRNREFYTLFANLLPGP